MMCGYFKYLINFVNMYCMSIKHSSWLGMLLWPLTRWKPIKIQSLNGNKTKSLINKHFIQSEPQNFLYNNMLLHLSKHGILIKIAFVEIWLKQQNPPIFGYLRGSSGNNRPENSFQ